MSRARAPRAAGSPRVALAPSWRAGYLAQGLGQVVHPVLRAGEAPSATGRARQLTSSPIQGLPVAWLGMLRKGDWTPHEDDELLELCTSDCTAAAGCARRPQQPSRLHGRR